jgi:hypothetical protein
MPDPITPASGATGDRSLTNLAVGLAAATVLTMFVLGAADADGPIWILQGALAAATAVVAWRAGGTSTRNPLAMGALVVGVALLALFLGFLVSEA